MVIYKVEAWDYDKQDGCTFFVDSIGDIDAVDEVAAELRRRGIVEYEATCCCCYGDGCLDFWVERSQGCEENFGYYESE